MLNSHTLFLPMNPAVHVYRWKRGWKMPRRIVRPVEIEVMRGYWLPEDSEFYHLDHTFTIADGMALLAAVMHVNATADPQELYEAFGDIHDIDERPRHVQIARYIDDRGRAWVWKEARQDMQKSTNPLEIADEMNRVSRFTFHVTPADVMRAVQHKNPHVRSADVPQSVRSAEKNNEPLVAAR